jgi:hypothetical protein
MWTLVARQGFKRVARRLLQFMFLSEQGVQGQNDPVTRPDAAVIGVVSRRGKKSFHALATVQQIYSLLITGFECRIVRSLY